MAIIGIFAVVLNYFDRVPSLLLWIYSWGDTVAWAIKIGLIVVGGALYFLGMKKEKEAVKTNDNQEVTE